MFSNIGVPGLILILVIALIIFGPSKLPQMGRAIGETLREFKKSTRDIAEDMIEADLQKDQTKDEKVILNARNIK